MFPLFPSFPLFPFSTMSEGYHDINNPLRESTPTAASNQQRHEQEGAEPMIDYEIECRVCRGSEGIMYSPCKCSGSIGMVHQECLEQWLHIKRVCCQSIPNSPDT